MWHQANQQIKFTNILDVPKEYSPKPASAFVPDWYKKLESYISGEKKPTGEGGTTATAKRCMPVFDAIVGGYIIVSAADVYVSQKKMEDGTKQPYFEWSSYGLIQFHPVEQMPEHPKRNGHMSYPKWKNPWAIKTPKGYSVLFTQPMHRESPFTILPGIVDTDTYTAPVNFPFVLNDINFEGLIPAGTPIAQVIPIKREEWKMSLGSQAEFIEQQQITNRLQTKFFDRYKSMFRQPKEYK
jgi:hypothetical protein